jgi:predicted acylesterase/phospholipase RssA
MAVKLRKKKKIAIVFSGGGIKAAAFHIGVCLALRERGFVFAGGSKDQVLRAYPEDHPLTVRSYVGSSAGAFVAAILSAGYSLESLVHAFDVGSGFASPGAHRNAQSLRPLAYRDIFYLNAKDLALSLPRALFKQALASGGFESLLKNKFKMNGLFTTKGLELYLRKHALLYNNFNSLGVDLFIVASQLNHSRKVVFGNFEQSTKDSFEGHFNYATISEAVACSTSLPPVFAPYGVTRPDQRKMFFFDGEIRDSLSTHVASDHGADLVISSYSYQPYHYTEAVGSLHKFGVPVIINQALYQLIQQKITRHIKSEEDISSIYRSMDSYFRQINLPEEQREKALEIIRQRVGFKPEVDYLYIHPGPQNHQMFFADHFSLNRRVLESTVRIGFKSAIGALRHYDF